jgi:N utilization substance protein B
LAVAELRSMPRTPTRVVVAEAVRIAGRYGSEHSAKFVNGLLAELASSVRGDPDATNRRAEPASDDAE